MYPSHNFSLSLNRSYIFCQQRQSNTHNEKNNLSVTNKDNDLHKNYESNYLVHKHGTEY